MAKNRFWSFLLYPESAGLEKCIELLEDLRIKACISPLHDKDLDREGNTKKAHYHVYLVYPNPISHNSVIDGICTPLGLNPYCLPLRDPGQAFLYLWHDSRNSKGKKVLYNKEDIIFLNGCNADDFPEKVKKKEELEKAFFRLRADIDKFDITEFCKLLEFVENSNDPIYQDLILEKSWLLDRFITSRRNYNASTNPLEDQVKDLKDQNFELRQYTESLLNENNLFMGFLLDLEKKTGYEIIDKILKSRDGVIDLEIDYSKFF